MPMEHTMTAVEVMGTVDENRQLHLDEDLPFAGPVRVRVLVLSPLDDESAESAWLYAAARSPAFAYLNDSAEDVYTAEDGEPFVDEV